MKFAVLCPPEIPIPLGDSYGGIELIAQDFADALAEMKHQVTLYCTMGKAIPERPDGSSFVALPELVLSDYPQGPITKDFDFTFDFTHQKQLAKFYTPDRYAATCFHTDALSKVRDVFPTRAVRAGFGVDGPVIYPGIRDVYKYSEDKESYLLFLGRVAPYKRPDVAILVAKMANRPIKVAGHIGKFSEWPDAGYGDTIRRMVERQKGAELIANPTLEQKVDLLSKASALVVPSDWSTINSFESFGIVAVEALMSGTPVLTSGDGGLKEIVKPGTGSGLVCRTLADYLDGVKHLDLIKPASCRARGEYFSAKRMAEEYAQYARETPP